MMTLRRWNIGMFKNVRNHNFLNFIPWNVHTYTKNFSCISRRHFIAGRRTSGRVCHSRTMMMAGCGTGPGTGTGMIIIMMGVTMILSGEEGGRHRRTHNLTYCESLPPEQQQRPKTHDTEKEDTDANTDIDDEYSYNEEEEETCPFCKFFLSSPCRDVFKPWHVCIKNSEQAIDCMEPFHPLRECMEEHGMIMDQDEEDEGGEENENEND